VRRTTNKCWQIWKKKGRQEGRCRYAEEVRQTQYAYAAGRFEILKGKEGRCRYAEGSTLGLSFIRTHFPWGCIQQFRVAIKLWGTKKDQEYSNNVNRKEAVVRQKIFEKGFITIIPTYLPAP